MTAVSGERRLLDQMVSWQDCDDRCDDPGEHAFYVSGGGFVWRWPKVTIYKPADSRPRAMWNRYPHNIIGAAVVLFGRCWGVTWKGSPRRRQAADFARDPLVDQ